MPLLKYCGPDARLLEHAGCAVGGSDLVRGFSWTCVMLEALWWYDLKQAEGPAVCLDEVCNMVIDCMGRRSISSCWVKKNQKKDTEAEELKEEEQEDDEADS